MTYNRTIKQIAVSATTEHQPDFIYALCEDGTLWSISSEHSDDPTRWNQFAPIPGTPTETPF